MPWQKGIYSNFCVWGTVVAGSSPDTRLSGRAVKLPGSFISRTGQNIFTRSGLMSGVHGGYSSAVRAGAQFGILRAGGGSNPPVCLPGRYPARLLSPFLDGPYFHSRSGRQQLPGVHEGELQASAGDQHHAGKRGRHPFSFLTRKSGSSQRQRRGKARRG